MVEARQTHSRGSDLTTPLGDSHENRPSVFSLRDPASMLTSLASLSGEQMRPEAETLGAGSSFTSR